MRSNCWKTVKHFNHRISRYDDNCHYVITDRIDHQNAPNSDKCEPLSIKQAWCMEEFLFDNTCISYWWNLLIRWTSKVVYHDNYSSFLTDSQIHKPWDSYVASKNEFGQKEHRFQNFSSFRWLLTGECTHVTETRIQRDLEVLLSLSRPASFEGEHLEWAWTDRHLSPSRVSLRFPHGRLKTSRSSIYSHYGWIGGRVHQKWKKAKIYSLATWFKCKFVIALVQKWSSYQGVPHVLRKNLSPHPNPDPFPYFILGYMELSGGLPQTLAEC